MWVGRDDTGDAWRGWGVRGERAERVEKVGCDARGFECAFEDDGFDFGAAVGVNVRATAIGSLF